VIPETNTVTDPRAVVVHFHGAFVADGAVVRPGRLDPIALVTESIVVSILDREIVSSSGVIVWSHC